MKTWFEVSITQKKRSRRSLIRKVTVIIVCIWLMLLLIDRYQSYALKGESTSMLLVTQMQPAIFSKENHQSFPAQLELTGSALEALTQKTQLKEKKALLRQIRMHNTLRSLSRRGNSRTDDSLVNTSILAP